jgi:hypothetical protein
MVFILLGKEWLSPAVCTRPVFSSSSAELAGLLSLDQPPGKLPSEFFLEFTTIAGSEAGRSNSALALATIKTEPGGGVISSK